MSEPGTKSGRPPLWAQGALILLAAGVLGWVYNGLTPLRIPAEAAAREVSPPPSAAAAPVKPSIARTGVHNETLSLTLELPAAPASGHAAHAATAPAIPSLKWPEVRALLDAGKIVLVDARLKANYDAGHIPGAILLPATSSVEEFRAFAGKYPKDTAFVTYCGSESCHMSHQLAESLIKICGFTNVRNMPGGYAEYTIAGGRTK
jgi:rhodanese-related sulfurtransferase